MWLQKISEKGLYPVNSNSTNILATPSTPKMENNHQYIKHGMKNTPNDVIPTIDFFKTNPSNNTKVRMTLQSQTIKISAIEAISHTIRKREYSLKPDDDSEGDDQDNEDNEESSTCRFEFLLRLFINLGYRICLIPFRLVPVTIGHKTYFEIRHHAFQRVISMIQCVTASFVCFLVAYAQIGGKNIEKNPLVIFNFWSYAVFCSWCFLFTNIFWRKEHLVLALVNSEPSTLHRNANTGNTSFSLDEIIAAMYFYGVVLEEIYHKSVFYLFPQVYGLQSAAEVYSGKAMYSIFLRNSTRPIPWEEISPATLSFTIWHFIAWESFGAIKSLFYIFVTFSSLFLIGRINRELRAVKQVTALINELPDGWNSRSKQIWSHFVKVRSTVKQVNELTNLCVLGIYLILVPFLSSAFIRRWDSDFIEYKILMVLQFVWPMIALVTASEATRLGDKFLRTVKEVSEEVNRSHNSEEGTHCLSSTYFVYENANLSMKGGKFFNVSYGFMGATFSVVMTYGLVILGFLHDMHTKKAKCSN